MDFSTLRAAFLLALVICAGLALTVAAQAPQDRAAALSRLPAVDDVLWSAEHSAPAFLSGSLRAADSAAPEAIASRFVAEQRALFNLDANDLVVEDIDHDKLGLTHVRIQQTVNGVPVWGGDAKVHLRPDGSVYAFGGDLYPRLAQVETTPALRSAEAVKAARYALEADLGEVLYRAAPTPDALAALHGEEAPDWSPTSRLVVLPEQGRLAYHVEVFADAPEPASWNVFVDAKTGEVVDYFNALHTAGHATLEALKAEHAKARGFAKANRSALNTPAPYAASAAFMPPASGTGTSFFGGTLPLATNLYEGTYYLFDNTRGPSYIRTMSAGNERVKPGQAVGDPDNAFTDEAHRAAVDAHYGTVTTYDYFLDTHGLDSFDGEKANITSIVNYGVEYNNAFWDGTHMVFGDGNGSYFNTLASLDIIAHEFGHGVTGNSAGLIYRNESGALNEAFSDIMAIMVDRDDYLLGEDSFTPDTPGDGLRDIADPTARNQPDHYSDRYTGDGDNGGVHTNSGIANKQAYLMIEGGPHRGVSVTALGKEKTEKIWFRALTKYFTSSTGFAAARRKMLRAAADLYGSGSVEQVAVQNAWAAVGVGESLIEDDAQDSAEQWYYVKYHRNTPHDYTNDLTKTHNFHKEGAAKVALYFERFRTEEDYDFVYIKDSNKEVQATYHGELDGFWAVVDGDKITSQLVTDGSLTYYGYKISKAAYYSEGALLVQDPDAVAMTEAPQSLASVAVEVGTKADLAFGLDQNAPNPFGRSTAISYALDQAGSVSLVVYDVLGRQVARLVDEVQEPGRYTAELDASRLASGTYLYVLQAGTQRQTKRMTLVK